MHRCDAPAIKHFQDSKIQLNPLYSMNSPLWLAAFLEHLIDHNLGYLLQLPEIQTVPKVQMT